MEAAAKLNREFHNVVGILSTVVCEEMEPGLSFPFISSCCCLLYLLSHGQLQKEQEGQAQRNHQQLKIVSACSGAVSVSGFLEVRNLFSIVCISWLMGDEGVFGHATSWSQCFTRLSPVRSAVQRAAWIPCDCSLQKTNSFFA